MGEILIVVVIIIIGNDTAKEFIAGVLQCNRCYNVPELLISRGRLSKTDWTQAERMD